MNSDIDAVLEREEEEDAQEMGSLNHSLIQARLIALLSGDTRFTAAIELSLDASGLDLSQFGLTAKSELKPDICLYPGELWLSDQGDILKMSEMPLLAIEVISPKQGFYDILNKFKAYFALNIRSCWLVMPEVRSVAVYRQINQFQTFDMHDKELIDEGMDIHLSIAKIFKK